MLFFLFLSLPLPIQGPEMLGAQPLLNLKAERMFKANTKALFFFKYYMTKSNFLSFFNILLMVTLIFHFMIKE